MTSVVPPQLSKCGHAIPPDEPRNTVRPTPQPVITVMSQTDFYSLGGELMPRRADSSTPADKYRLWEVAGASHSSEYTTGFVPSPADLAKTGHSYAYYNCTSPGVSNDFPMQYVLGAAQVDLDRWARYGSAPPRAARIEVDSSGNTVLDAHGNAVGGVRTP